MKKLSDYKNGEALDLLADIIEPVISIMQDEKVKEAFQSDNKLMNTVKAIVKGHKDDVIEILARLDDTPAKDYQCTIFTLPIKVLEILNDKQLLDFFNSAVGAVPTTASIGVTEITKEEKK